MVIVCCLCVWVSVCGQTENIMKIRSLPSFILIYPNLSTSNGMYRMWRWRSDTQNVGEKIHNKICLRFFGTTKNYWTFKYFPYQPDPPSTVYNRSFSIDFIRLDSKQMESRRRKKKKIDQNQICDFEIQFDLDEFRYRRFYHNKTNTLASNWKQTDGAEIIDRRWTTTSGRRWWRLLI